MLTKVFNFFQYKLELKSLLKTNIFSKILMNNYEINIQVQQAITIVVFATE